MLCTNNSTGLSRSKCLKKIQKYQTMLWGTEDSSSEDSQVFNSNKYIALDSGASTTCVTNINASDIAINLNRNNMEELPTVTAADGSEIRILGQGKLLNHPVQYSDLFKINLLSVSATATANSALALFTDTGCHIVSNLPEIRELINKILLVAQNSNSLLINGKLVDGMYLVKLSDVMKNKHKLQQSSKHITSVSGNFLDSDDNKPIEILPSDLDLKFVGSSYYTKVPSVSVRTAAELIRYFHEAWNHASKEIMCAIINNQLIDNLPKALTAKLVNRHFPACDSCPF